MKTIDLIPHYMHADGTSETIDLGNGYTARITLEHDSDHGAPWEECDGHGPVSDWRDKDSKAAGERVLHSDRGRARFYDFAAAVKLARKDGWGAEGDEGMAPGAKAAYAAEKDFEYLRAWCNDEWHYMGVIVTLHDASGAEVASNSCWGVESIGDYWREVAAENLDECLHAMREAQRTETLRRAFL